MRNTIFIDRPMEDADPRGIRPQAPCDRQSAPRTGDWVTFASRLFGVLTRHDKAHQTSRWAAIPRTGNRALLAATIASLSAPAMAQDGPTPGCYMRDYSQAHLDAHPDQVVRSVGMWIHDNSEYSERYAYLVVDFANQGHVRRDGHGAQRLDQSLVCYRMQDGRQGCAVDCDGGSFTVSKETDTTLTISTSYLMVGEVDGCGGAIDMAEHVGKDVKYRLNKVADAQCLALIEN